jgi:cytochrome c peroxidase
MRPYLLSLCVACGAAGEVDPERDLPELPWAAELMPAAPFPADNPPSEPKRLLGRALFYDPITSSDRATACVTCHSEIWGLGDQLPRSVGVGGKGPIGPGRVGPHMTRRNSPALWNVAHKERLFWDGRVSSLEEQALLPMENADELARDPAELVAELGTIAAYRDEFRAAFPGEEQPITVENVARALATFVRAYQSDRAPYDQYLRGDLRALDAHDRNGMALFAELDCDGCHVPPRFESELYADRNVPSLEEIPDEGRAEATQVPADRGLFRVPTLRNVRETGPFFHAGSVATLEDAIRHEVAQQVALGRRALSEAELADLNAFVRRALVDTSREQHPPKAVPSGLPIPLDGDRLLRGGEE